jgi:hypothetical protein
MIFQMVFKLVTYRNKKYVYQQFNYSSNKYLFLNAQLYKSVKAKIALRNFYDFIWILFYDEILFFYL